MVLFKLRRFIKLLNFTSLYSFQWKTCINIPGFDIFIEMFAF